LLQKGVEPGDRVGLLIGNSVDFVVAALGCLWAGATFVPLAITDPDLRRAQIVADCRPAQVITAGSDQTAPSGLPVGTAWTTLSALSVADGRTPPPVTGRISYIIYTSGTTGVPKGVQISPTAFFTAVEACADAVGLTADDRCLCVSPVHFDGSFSAIFPPLVRQCRTDFPYEVRIAETMIASDAQIFASLRDGDRHHQSLPDSMIKDFLHAVRKKPNS
jgi:non-ribosomal peptide synthetase component F